MKHTLILTAAMMAIVMSLMTGCGTDACNTTFSEHSIITVKVKDHTSNTLIPIQSLDSAHAVLVRADGSIPSEFFVIGSEMYFFMDEIDSLSNVNASYVSTLYWNQPNATFPGGIDTDTIRFEYNLKPSDCPKPIDYNQVNAFFNGTLQYTGDYKTGFIFVK